LYEVIERDAFSITWLNRLPVPKIKIESSPLIYKLVHEKLSRAHLDYSLYHLATDLDISCVLCVLIDNSRHPKMICSGGAAHLDPEKAAVKALIEAVQTYQWAKYLGKQSTPFVVAPDYSNINDFERHVFLYAYGDMIHAIRFLSNTKASVSFSEIPSGSSGNNSADLQRVLRAVQSRGHEVIAIDLTAEDVKSCGYRVVKVLIPAAQQLEGDHNHRFLGGSRLYEVPVALGYPVRHGIESLNPDPHPYP
jgi:ribosomal protein S12 methylthiotransferase accessory factor